MAQELVFDERTQSAKNWVWGLYLAHGFSMFFTLGAMSFIPLILNYIKRDDTNGTFLTSHHSWMIRSFWWYVVWVVVGWFVFWTIIGIPLAWMIWVCAWIWKMYRLLRGYTALSNNVPIDSN